MVRTFFQPTEKYPLRKLYNNHFSHLACIFSQCHVMKIAPDCGVVVPKNLRKNFNANRKCIQYAVEGVLNSMILMCEWRTLNFFFFVCVAQILERFRLLNWRSRTRICKLQTTAIFGGFGVCPHSLTHCLYCEADNDNEADSKCL